MTRTFESRRSGRLISTDPRLLDVDAIHRSLASSYWAEEIPREVVAKSLDGSLNFGMYEGDCQIGFARVVTDCATFAYLCDVYVLEEYRGLGLGHWLIETVQSHPDLKMVRRFVLITRDAHTLYSAHGFQPLANPEGYMEIARPGMYKTAERK